MRGGGSSRKEVRGRTRGVQLEPWMAACPDEIFFPTLLPDPHLDACESHRFLPSGGRIAGGDVSCSSSRPAAPFALGFRPFPMLW